MARLKELAVSRTDLFWLPASRIIAQEGFNVRFDFGSDFEEFTNSILENGIQVAISGHKDDKDNFVITDGHRRITGLSAALKILDARLKGVDSRSKEAKEIKAHIERISVVPCSSEPQDYTDKDRNYDIATRNSGKELNLLEYALLFHRLQKDHGEGEETILRRTGRTKTMFANCVLLNGAPDLHPFIRSGQVAASLAVEVCRKVKDNTARLAIITDGIKTAKNQGKSRATAKDLPAPVREKVAPTKKGSAAARKAAANGSASTANGNGNSSGSSATHRFDAVTGSANGKTGVDSSTKPAPVASLESVLGSRTIKNLSALMDAKWKIEGQILLSQHRVNKTYFYNLHVSQNSQEHDSGWRYAAVASHLTKTEANAATEGFDEADGALLAAYKEIYQFLDKHAGKFTQKALAVIKTAMKNLTKSEADTSGTNGGDDIEVPADPTETDKRLSEDMGDTAPADSDEAIDGMNRVFADVSGITGITRNNKQYETVKYLTEYFRGEHTHNELKALILYGSTETRHLTKSEA